MVIGGSAGAIEALRSLMRSLPADLPATILVVIHTHPSSPGYLPQILEREGPLPVAYATDGARLAHGRVVIAPADRHLLIERDQLRLTHGPKENRSRPAVDPLFRSAAYFHGPRVIGVVLSGMLDDGTAGLWTIKDRGGLAVVQAPDDAQFASMPESALRHVAVDQQRPAEAIGPLLARLVAEPAAPPTSAVPAQLRAETRIALEDNALDLGILDLGALSPFGCPECHGVMVQLQEGGLLRFRCHTGHAFSAATLLALMSESIEESLWNTMRGMEERALLLHHLARHLRDADDGALAARFEAQSHEVRRRAEQIKAMALQHQQVGLERLRGDEPRANGS